MWNAFYTFDLLGHIFFSIQHWKRWVVQKGAGGQERLNTILKGLLLRRTKEQLQANNEIEMPEKEEHVIDIFLDKEEMNVYQKVNEVYIFFNY